MGDGQQLQAVKCYPGGLPLHCKGRQDQHRHDGELPLWQQPVVAMQILVYDATGPNGTPGVQIGGPLDFTPTGYGWNSFHVRHPGDDRERQLLPGSEAGWQLPERCRYSG